MDLAMALSLGHGVMDWHIGNTSRISATIPHWDNSINEQSTKRTRMSHDVKDLVLEIKIALLDVFGASTV